jgi:predicted dehydrogenase
MGKFTFAVFGAGKIAPKFIDAARRSNCDVVAIASKDIGRASAFAAANGIPRAYGGYTALLDAERVDCVYIATVPSSHFELTELCLSRGIPVLCEKAMFRNSSEAEAAFAISREKNVFAMEALWSKFLPALVTAKGWLDDGRIGAPIAADITIGFRAPSDPNNRYFNPSLGGGVALDLTVYAYEIITHMLSHCGDEEILGVGVTRGPTGTDDTESVLIRFGGCLATLKTTFTASVNESLVIYGEDGRIVVPHPHYSSEAVLYESDGIIAEHFVDTETKNGFVYEVREVVRCVREGRGESDTQPHCATLSCARLFDLINNQ